VKACSCGQSDRRVSQCESLTIRGVQQRRFRAPLRRRSLRRQAFAPRANRRWRDRIYSPGRGRCDQRLKWVAVELDFMQPNRPMWLRGHRHGHQNGQCGGHEIRLRSGFATCGHHRLWHIDLCGFRWPSRHFLCDLGQSRPVLAANGASGRTSAKTRAVASSPLISSKLSRFSRGLPCLPTRCHRPISFSPARTNS